MTDEFFLLINLEELPCWKSSDFKYSLCGIPGIYFPGGRSVGAPQREVGAFRATGTKIKSVSLVRLAIGVKTVQTKNADSTSMSIKLKTSSQG